MRVDIEEIIKLKEGLKAINKVDFYDIIWYKDGKPLDISMEHKNKFQYIGFCNTDFVDFLNWPEYFK